MLLKTDRIYLRNLNDSDYNSLCEMLRDDDVMKQTSFRGAVKESNIAATINRWKIDPRVYGAFSIGTDEIIGWFMLKETICTSPEIGFMLAKKAWNKGYATEISKALLEYAKKQLSSPSVIARVDDDNIKSQNVLEKLGMKRTDKYPAKEGLLYYEINFQP